MVLDLTEHTVLRYMNLISNYTISSLLYYMETLLGTQRRTPRDLFREKTALYGGASIHDYSAD